MKQETKRMNGYDGERNKKLGDSSLKQSVVHRGGGLVKTGCQQDETTVAVGPGAGGKQSVVRTAGVTTECNLLAPATLFGPQN